MIISTLADSHRYASLSSNLARGFEFLQGTDPRTLADGRLEIDGDTLFAIVARGAGRGPAASPLEYHRRYIDIQYVVSGTELFGWSPLQDCKMPTGPFNDEADIGFWRDTPTCWTKLIEGQFVVFFPEDAHAPLAGEGEIFKIVMKVAIG